MTVAGSPAVVPLDPTIATIRVPKIAVPTIPVPKAAGPYHAGQRGSPAMPAGRSGGSGGGGCGNAYPYPYCGP